MPVKRGQKINYPKSRRSPKKHSVKKHKRKGRPVKKFNRGGSLALGSIWGNEKGLKSGRLFTEKDKNPIKLGSLWGTDGRKKKK